MDNFILYNVSRNGVSSVYKIDLNGSEQAEIINSSEINHRYPEIKHYYPNDNELLISYSKIKVS